MSKLAMINFQETWSKIERFFGHVKFAVFIILIFAIYLTYGTFMESYHGTDYANRLVYKSWPFMTVQFFMFLSVLFATLLRMPFKKPLAGFYVLHLGLLILFLGSFITYVAGVDGSLTLNPNSPNREVLLNSDEVRIQLLKAEKEVKVALPYTSGPKELKMDYKNIKLLKFLPFADDELTWVKQKEAEDANKLHSSTYIIKNDMVEEKITLSLHPASLGEFKNSTQMGPLSVHYMPKVLASCFDVKTNHGFIMWDPIRGGCFSPAEKSLKTIKSLVGPEKLSFVYDGKLLTFIPSLSPLPIKADNSVDESSPLRLFNRSLFEDKPHLFLFGEAVAFYNREETKWYLHPLKKLDGWVELPWMGFQLQLSEHFTRYHPRLLPNAVIPIQDNNNLVQGAQRAVLASVGDDTFWVKRNEPFTYKTRDEEYTFILTTSSLKLPFELSLKRFKMDQDPGTNNPASYESFVTLFRGNSGSTEHHVFMNHPLKQDDFTFYQSSFFEIEPQVYGSVLSVNYDPGRWWKYLGSLLLVGGSFWHFVLRRRKEKKS
jgi:hypothetical protein